MLNEVTDVADFLNLLYLKLSPWFKIKILTVTPWSVSFSIGEFDELFAMNDSGWKLQTTSNKPGTQGDASRHFANHLNGILSGSVRDDAGNLQILSGTTMFSKEVQKHEYARVVSRDSKFYNTFGFVYGLRHQGQMKVASLITNSKSGVVDIFLPASDLEAIPPGDVITYIDPKDGVAKCFFKGQKVVVSNYDSKQFNSTFVAVISSIGDGFVVVDHPSGPRLAKYAVSEFDKLQPYFDHSNGSAPLMNASQREHVAVDEGTKSDQSFTAVSEITPYSTTFFHKKVQKVELEKPWDPKVGDPVQFVFLGSTRHGDKGVVTMTTEGWPEKEYLFQSNCGKFGRWCTIAELKPIEPKPQGSIEVISPVPEGFRLLAHEPRMSSDGYWSLGCKDWVLIGDRVDAANRDMWPAIRFVANEAEPVKQFVLVFDGENDQALYVDGLLKNTDSTLYACDIADAAEGCTVKIEVRDVKVSGSWAKSLSDLVTEDATCKQTLQVQPDHIGDANKKVDPLPSEEKPKDRTVFEVGDPVVTFNGRRGSIEAFGLIEDFPITVRHSKRETVSYRLGDVWLDTDAKTVAKESLTTEPEQPTKKYRTPTILDLSNGPIRCEVFDEEDEVWTKRWLTFVSDRRAFPFVTVDPENKDKSGSWKRCRIEVAFDPVTDLSQTAARMVGKAIDQMIHKGELVKPQQLEPVIKDCLTTEANCPEIPDSSNSSESPVSLAKPERPWTPKAGEKVRIKKPKDCDNFRQHWLDSMEIYDGMTVRVEWIEGEVIFVDGRVFHFGWLEPANCPKILDSSSCPKILDSSSEGMRDAFEAEMAKRCKLKSDQLRTDGKGRYFDLHIEQYWQAFQAGAEWKSSNTDSYFYFVANGYPCIRERVVVTRKSGQKLTARLAYTRDSSFRNCNNLHWLTDDDKFADVGFDPIVSWSREPIDAPSPSLAASDLAKEIAEKIRMKKLLDATSKPPKTLNAARDLSSHFWEEAYQIMISLFNSGLSVEQIKQELLSRLPEGASSK